MGRREGSQIAIRTHVLFILSHYSNTQTADNGTKTIILSMVGLGPECRMHGMNDNIRYSFSQNFILRRFLYVEK